MRGRTSAGFTLLEAMIALAIMAVSLLGLLAAVSGSIQSATESVARRAAREACRAKIEEVLAGAESPDGGGELEDHPGFRWNARTEEVAIGVPDRASESVKVVTVEVTFPLDRAQESSGSSSSSGAPEGMGQVRIAAVLPPEEQAEGSGG